MSVKLEVVTPELKVLECQADLVSLPGSLGEMGVLPGHLPLLTTLKPGVLSASTSKDGNHVFAIGTGFAEVLPDRVTILTDTAVNAGDIDIAQAKAQLNTAEAALKEANDGKETDGPIDFEATQQLQVSVQRAQALVDAVAQKK